jgi:hypothetical protein
MRKENKMSAMYGLMKTSGELAIIEQELSENGGELTIEIEARLENAMKLKDAQAVQVLSDIRDREIFLDAALEAQKARKEALDTLKGQIERYKAILLRVYPTGLKTPEITLSVRNSEKIEIDNEDGCISECVNTHDGHFADCVKSKVVNSIDKILLKKKLIEGTTIALETARVIKNKTLTIK